MCLLCIILLLHTNRRKKEKKATNNHLLIKLSINQYFNLRYGCCDKRYHVKITNLFPKPQNYIRQIKFTALDLFLSSRLVLACHCCHEHKEPKNIRVSEWPVDVHEAGFVNLTSFIITSLQFSSLEA